MLANELREMTDEQLDAELNSTRKELFNLKFQAAVERIDAPSNLRRLRREMARIKTIQRERQIAAQREEAATAPAASDTTAEVAAS